MSTLLSLDQGTSSSRAIVFDLEGRPVSSAQREFRQIYPQPAWVEHDANEIWQTQLDVAVRAAGQARAAGKRIAAIGITNQRETTVLWDRATGLPVANAIVWQDRRTADACMALREAGHEDAIRRKTGLVVDAYFSGTKLRWLLDHVPGARERAKRGELAFGTIDSWLIFKLTGGKVHATDVSNASRTLLCNIHTATWDDELLSLLDIPRAVLPQIVASSGFIGVTDCPGPIDGLPITGVAGDQQAALFGQACHRPGEVKNTYGTGCFMLMNTGQVAVPSHNRLLTTIAWKLPGETVPTYALEGSVFIAGAAIQWLRDGLRLFDHAGDIEALAASVPDSGGVMFVPAFAGLGAPHWDPHARGTLLGLTRGTSRAHIARATLEAIALQCADLVTAMEADAGISAGTIRVDGGACVNDLLMQLQADLAQTQVARPVISETTALGAAGLAGLGARLWTHVGELGDCWQLDREFVPNLSPTHAMQVRQQWHEAINRSRGWAATRT
ncbi:MAG: glycerol kinase GlpK [Betaproteobacteria bacterium]|nr:glycerol kinase GlpK [Betaproteobacteria bacterium]